MPYSAHHARAERARRDWVGHSTHVRPLRTPEAHLLHSLGFYATDALNIHEGTLKLKKLALQRG